MWLFTRYGFFSVTKPKFGAAGRPADEFVQVRGRVRAHLEALKSRFAEIENCEILTTKNSDYRFRIIVGHSIWASVAQQLAEDIDYDNFKDACAKTGSWLNPSYVSALHKVWGIHHGLQAPPEADVGTNTLPNQYRATQLDACRIQRWPLALLRAMSGEHNHDLAALLAFCSQQPSDWIGVEQGLLNDLVGSVLSNLPAPDCVSLMADLCTLVLEAGGLNERTKLALPAFIVVLRKRGSSLLRFAPCDLTAQVNTLAGHNDDQNPAHWDVSLAALRHCAQYFDAVVCASHEALDGDLFSSSGGTPDLSALASNARRELQQLVTCLALGKGPASKLGQLLTLLRNRVEASVSWWAFYHHGFRMPRHLLVGTEWAQLLMCEQKMFPATYGDGPKAFLWPLGGHVVSPDGEKSVVVGYAFRQSGEAVYFVENTRGNMNTVACAEANDAVVVSEVQKKTGNRRKKALSKFQSVGSSAPSIVQQGGWNLAGTLDAHYFSQIQPRLKAYPYPSN